MYYNTTSLFGEELQAEVANAETQDELVMDVFKALKMPLSPSLVYRFLINRKFISDRTPITSIRRAITNMAQAGLIVKTGTKVVGIYGKKENQWKLT